MLSNNVSCYCYCEFTWLNLQVYIFFTYIYIQPSFASVPNSKCCQSLQIHFRVIFIAHRCSQCISKGMQSYLHTNVCVLIFKITSILTADRYSYAWVLVMVNVASCCIFYFLLFFYFLQIFFGYFSRSFLPSTNGIFLDFFLQIFLRVMPVACHSILI